MTDEERSVHTVMVYLNSERQYQGGETAFHVQHDAAAERRTVKVHGAKGKALVFKHNMWHEVRRSRARSTHTSNDGGRAAPSSEA